MAFCAFQSCIVLACDENDNETIKYASIFHIRCGAFQSPELSALLFSGPLNWLYKVYSSYSRTLAPLIFGKYCLSPRPKFDIWDSAACFFIAQVEKILHFLFKEPGSLLHFNHNFFFIVYHSKLHIHTVWHRLFIDRSSL